MALPLQSNASLLSLPIPELPGEGFRQRQLAAWLYQRGRDSGTR